MVAFTFPGQGSQRPGMGRDWTTHPSWELVDEASAVAGRDVAALLLDAAMEELTETANAQLATFVLSLVILDAIERVGLAPAACAGHSLGEYTALVAAGGVSFADGVALVTARGEAMARSGEDAPGTMAAIIGLSDDDAEAACQRCEAEVWVANYNAPGQVVVAGTSDAVASVAVIARRLGARKILPLPVAAAFHTPLMASARPALRKAIADATFVAPEVPIVANVDARVHDDPAEWPGLLSAQLCSPVRWRQSVETLAGLGTTTLVELGPGGVLSGLARRGAAELRALSVARPDDLNRLLEALAPGEEQRADVHVHHGEHLYTSERVVVSPGAGIFAPESSIAAPGTGLLPGTSAGGSPGDDPHVVDVGDLVGRVGVIEVRTPFAGQVIRWLSVAGERVQEGQPLVWLRVLGDQT